MNNLLYLFLTIILCTLFYTCIINLGFFITIIIFSVIGRYIYNLNI